MFEIRFSKPATRDLVQIADYLEKEAGIRTAKGVLARIRRQIKTLERDALRYRERMELGRGRRAILIGPYLAFYRGEGDIVFIQRILHGARNIKLSLFKEP